jgi:hypothetical protein
MASWPASLPNPIIDSYQLSPSDAPLRTEMEFGAARARRLTFARNDRVNAAWKFTDAQMDIFRTWFDDAAEAAGGSAWFTISLPVGNTGLTSQEARFVGLYKASLLPGLNWSVSAELEVRDV